MAYFLKKLVPEITITHQEDLAIKEDIDFQIHTHVSAEDDSGKAKTRFACGRHFLPSPTDTQWLMTG